MGHSVRRWRDELRSIEKQLPLFYQKISDLEKRHTELKSLIGEDSSRETGKTKAPAAQTAELPGRRRHTQLSLPGPRLPTASRLEPVKREETMKNSSPLAFLAKENVIGVLGEVNQKLHFLNQVVYKAANNVDTLMLVINFLEQSGGDLQQQIMSIAEQVRTQMENPEATASTDSGNASVQPTPRLDNLNINPEMISEIMKSPLFHQLVTQFSQSSQQN